MRLRLAAGMVAALALAACGRVDRAAVSAPQFAHVQDTVGTPDLIVDAAKLGTSWVVYDQELKESFCSIEEANLAPGKYRVLRFTVNTPNIGDADVFIGSPWKHMDPDGDLDFSDSDGLYEESTCHQHFHFRNYALYQLIDTTGKIFRARKNGFCMIDITPWSEEVPPGSWVYRSCGRSTIPLSGFQGISVGYGDEYFKWLGGQYFVLNGDPNAEEIPPGQYILRITVNPPFTPRNKKEPCPAKDGDGFCHMFAESNYDNNIGQALITIPAGRPGKTGFGPGGGQEPKDEMIDDENRPIK